MTTSSPDAAEPKLPPGVISFNGNRYLKDVDGSLIPVEAIKAADLLQDEVVRGLHAKAAETAASLAAFKAASFDEVDAVVQLLFEKYKAKIGGAKGNITLRTFDGLMEIQVQTAELVSYGVELQAAKALIDECVAEWTADVRAELLVLLKGAFVVNKEGQVSRSKLLMLRRYEFKDERWVRAMQAIADAEVPEGSKRYIRFRWRSEPGKEWQSHSLNIANA